MVTALTYVRGRTESDTTESGSPTREVGQFASPFLSAPVRAASSHRVQLPATGLTAASGAVVLYLDPDNNHDGGGQPASGRAFAWRASADDRITGLYDKSGGTWTLEVSESGASDSVTVSDTFTAGDAIALYFAWDASGVYVAVDGGAIQSASRTKTPAGLPATLDVGSQDGSSNHLDAAFGTVALFSAPLSQTQWEALAALRDERPPVFGERSDDTMTALWYGAHQLVWSAEAAIDLNDSDDGDFRLLRLDGSGTAPVINRVVQTPQRDGAVYVDSRLGPRLISAQLAIVGEGWTSMWAKRREITDKLNPRRGAGLLMFAPDDTVYEINAVVDQGLSFSNPRGPHAQEQAVTFLCDDPAWRVAAINEATIVAPESGASVAMSVPLSISSGTTSAVAAAGDLPSYPQVHITFDDDDTEDPRVSNNTTSKDFVLDGSFSTSQSVDIDMNERTALDGFGNNLMGQRTATSQMWALEPGDNTVEASMRSGGITARLRWWTRYVGI